MWWFSISSVQKGKREDGSGHMVLYGGGHPKTLVLKKKYGLAVREFMQGVLQKLVRAFTSLCTPRVSVYAEWIV